MNGLLLIDKPTGWTSFDVVAKVRGILRQAANQSSVVSNPKAQTTENRQQRTSSPKVKVGHTGTLDPLATGLLVIVVGDYTKRAQELSKLDKTYEVTMKLGQTSTTGDDEGDKTTISTHRPTDKAVQAAVEQFIGVNEQTPPIYSAIKVNGQRAYKLAREGKEVKLEPREVTIYDITDLHYNYPELTFTSRVSSGTYIRSLVEDIGKQLETGAYMTGLRRSGVGVYAVKEALTLKDLNAEIIHENLKVL